MNLIVQWRTVAENNQFSSLSENNLWDSLMRKLRDLQINYIVQRLQVIDSEDQKNLSALISEVYCKLTEVFSEAQTETLSLHHKGDHAIELLERTTLSFKSMYNLSVKELKVLQQYLDVNLKNNFIQPLWLSAEALVLFTLKSDRALQLCVNYQRLNTIIKKNWYSLSLIDKIINCVSDTKIFIKINVKNMYYCIHIHKDDEWKTVFCTHYRLYKYLIMSFRLINASVSFQFYIHRVLYEYLNIFVIVFLNNILIYSMKKSKHRQHMQTVLQVLLKAKLFIKLFKCLFSVKQILYLGFIITDTEIKMTEYHIFIIVNWSESESVHEVQTFLSFMNFYWRFIQSFFCIAVSLTDIIKEFNAKLKKKLILWRADFLSLKIKTAF